MLRSAADIRVPQHDPVPMPPLPFSLPLQITDPAGWQTVDGFNSLHMSIHSATLLLYTVPDFRSSFFRREWEGLGGGGGGGGYTMMARNIIEHIL